MTYTRFRQLWQALITDRAMPARPAQLPPMDAHHCGISKHTEDELVKVAEGKPSAFDQISLNLRAETELQHGNLP